MGQTSTDEELAARKGEFAVVGEGTRTLHILVLTGCTVVRMVPPIALTPVMGEVERLGTTVEKARMMGQVLWRGRRVME